MKHILSILFLFTAVTSHAQLKRTTAATEAATSGEANLAPYIERIKEAKSKEELLKIEKDFISKVGIRSSLYAEMGTAYMGLNENTLAVAAYQQALSLNSMSSTIYNRLGLALMKIGYWRQAETSFKAALALTSNPSSRVIYLNNLALTFESLQQFKDAKTMTDIALRLNPSHQDSIQIQNRLKEKVPSLF
ncbi:MAG: tetratricopeptide repeat protein [Brevinema sp.]